MDDVCEALGGLVLICRQNGCFMLQHMHVILFGAMPLLLVYLHRPVNRK